MEDMKIHTINVIPVIMIGGLTELIVNADGKAIEWYAGSFLANDKIAAKEIWDGVDQHSLNQEAFGLPSRLIAKKFIFRKLMRK